MPGRRLSGRPSPARQRGFALLIVLWTLALITLIGTQVTAAGHSEARIAENLRASAVAEAAADAAVQEAALHLLDGSAAHWSAGPTPHVLRLAHAVVSVDVENESGKLPLNTSPTVLIAAVIRELGVDPGLAAVVADQIADWRSPANFPLKLGAKAPQYRAAGRAWGPPGRPFRTTSELRLVLGVTPQLYALLAPHVTAYTESAPSTSPTGDPLVRRAMQQMAAGGLQPLSFDEAPIYRVTATAVSSEGGRFVRSAIIRLAVATPAAPITRPFDVLAWGVDPVTAED